MKRTTFKKKQDDFNSTLEPYEVDFMITDTGWGLVWFMVFNTTFNNISVISLQSDLFDEETGEKCRPVASHWQTDHIMLYRVHPSVSGIWSHNSSTECTSSYKYTTAPNTRWEFWPFAWFGVIFIYDIYNTMCNNQFY